jgi:hypothetical protein
MISSPFRDRFDERGSEVKQQPQIPQAASFHSSDGFTQRFLRLTASAIAVHFWYYLYSFIDANSRNVALVSSSTDQT